MAVPSNCGQVGLVFSLLSLAPWLVFAILAWRCLQHLVRSVEPAATTAMTDDA
ncbi:hypothetical protein [Arthrobacter sp. H35-D1]|uniref:hypothetical protein n=1 Tax=Arthrobacter sp. H35-D1 TaxID=3046202 RepID=UPI0024BB097C|nr:hypothetical protein [Arthrobacter sp. H35-D1]MDJ0314267.1 hypothetical protein [Arthrobacter sp. H35-D1]